MERSSSTQEIRKLYRRYAAVNHPDKNPNTDRKKFSEITAIFNFLSDPDLRWNYDRFNIINQDKFIEFWEFAMQLLNIFIKYFQWTAFSTAIFSERKGIKDKNKCILTILIGFIYSVYNTTIRNKYLKDPFDLIFPQITIYERNNLVIEFLPIQLALARLCFGLFCKIHTNNLALSFMKIDLNLDRIQKEDTDNNFSQNIL